jgi:Protein of unknown function (DUF3617)
MRRLILPGAALLCATVLNAAGLDPLNIKTGLWRITMTSSISSTPKPITNTYDSCVKKEDLAKYPFTDPKDNCNWNVVSSTGTQMEAHGTCQPQGMGNVNFSIKLEAANSENVKGTGQLTLQGPAGAISGTYSGTAKWINAMCPAGTK